MIDASKRFTQSPCEHKRNINSMTQKAISNNTTREIQTIGQTDFLNILYPQLPTEALVRTALYSSLKRVRCRHSGHVQLNNSKQTNIGTETGTESKC